MSQIISVTQVVSSIKNVLERSVDLSNLTCTGEISNLTKHASGHWYFSLKDAHAKINCVMFRQANLKVIHPIAEGDEVIVNGFVTIYAGSGQVQLILNSMQLAGQGILYRKYIECRDRLHRQGYFNKEHKKPLPKYPMSIGVIAGGKSAALADILKSLSHRWPIAEVVVYESLVQGINAPQDLIRNVLKADKSQHDVLILARGGGSLEDLWAFNDEELVKVIYNIQTPLVSGVGHEIDITLVDYVADIRGLTPTAAAQLATPDQREVRALLKNMNQFLLNKQKYQLTNLQLQLNSILSQSVISRPQMLYLDYSLQLEANLTALKKYQQTLVNLKNKLILSHNQLTYQSKQLIENRNYSISQINSQLLNRSSRFLSNKNHLLNQLDTQLKLKSPLELMKKGYVLTYQQQLVKSKRDLDYSKELTIVYYDGKIQTTLVKEKGNE